MKTHPMSLTLFASMLLLGAASHAGAQTTAQDHDAHHPPEEAQAATEAPADGPPGQGMPGGMGGMGGMMTPEMMQMMRERMGGMMGGRSGEEGSPGTGMGRGMMSPEMMEMMERMQGMMGRRGGEGEPPGTGMGRGMGTGMGPGMMMGPGAMGMCPMMMGMKGGGMGAMMGGPGLLYGGPHGEPEEMTPERVRELLEGRLEWHGNPRLAIGEIATAQDGSIVAEIVTVDGSLVQKLAFNRYPGLYRQIRE
jgi:hypothetical protein